MPAPGVNALLRAIFGSERWLLPDVVLARHDLERDLTSHDKAAIDRVEAYIRRAVREDMKRFRPDLVAVYDHEYVHYLKGPPFDFLEWLLHEPEFARIWENYELVGRSGLFACYRRQGR